MAADGTAGAPTNFRAALLPNGPSTWGFGSLSPYDWSFRPWLDTRVQLRDNLIFQLRCPRQSEPFSLFRGDSAIEAFPWLEPSRSGYDYSGFHSFNITDGSDDQHAYVQFDPLFP